MNQTEYETSDPYHKSMQLLHNTVTGSDSLQWDDGEYGKVEIFVRGMSRRWYKINAHQLTPDIIGENISKELEKLQDKLPPFDSVNAKNVLREEIGKENFDK